MEMRSISGLAALKQQQQQEDNPKPNKYKTIMGETQEAKKRIQPKIK